MRLSNDPFCTKNSDNLPYLFIKQSVLSTFCALISAQGIEGGKGSFAYSEGEIAVSVTESGYTIAIIVISCVLAKPLEKMLG